MLIDPGVPAKAVWLRVVLASRSEGRYHVGVGHGNKLLADGLPFPRREASPRRGFFMVLADTPHEGKVGVTVLLVGWAVELVLLMVGLYFGVRYIRGGSPGRQRVGKYLLLAWGTAPLWCCLTVPVAFRLEHDRYPLPHDHADIRPGMTREEVTDALDPPHDRDVWPDGEERWVYWYDSFGGTYYRVSFGPDGRVTHASDD
jgi:hypothetical protein